MNGILLINKEKDYTSRDIVNIVSKELKTKKIGHTGTLDPLATGVLVLTIGSYTKLSELLTATYKEYIAEVILGINTDTLDITGNILEDKDCIIEKELIEQTLKKMIGFYEQEVPIYSAVKVNGKKLYEYARNNEEVILPKKMVEIKNIELLDYKIDGNKTNFKFKCLVSKGTYIRSLIRDIAFKLNTVGVMKNLTRTKQGNFNIEDCYTLEDIKNNNYKLLDVDNCLDIKQIDMNEELEYKIKNGQIINNIYNEDIIMFRSSNIISIYKKYDKDKNKLKPWKVIKVLDK